MGADPYPEKIAGVRCGPLSKCGALLFLGFVAGCSTPAQRMDQQATELGFHKLVVSGSGFSHVAYLKEGRSRSDTSLHVYLEGDGSPWVMKRVAASDPTPRNPLMLGLMALDPAPAIYLGRPCYQGLNSSAGCTPDVWTDRRYSEDVVASMSAALERLSINNSALILIGHSGGGTLAMLMAERLPKVKTVMTVAANLDTEKWVSLHRQGPLAGSMNPAIRPPLPERIRQVHYAGGQDDNVPPALIRKATERQPNAQFIVLQGEGHSCCWQDIWPELLEVLGSE